MISLSSTSGQEYYYLCILVKIVYYIIIYVAPVYGEMKLRVW